MAALSHGKQPVFIGSQHKVDCLFQIITVTEQGRLNLGLAWILTDNPGEEGVWGGGGFSPLSFSAFS